MQNQRSVTYRRKSNAVRWSRNAGHHERRENTRRAVYRVDRRCEIPQGVHKRRSKKKVSVLSKCRSSLEIKGFKKRPLQLQRALRHRLRHKCYVTWLAEDHCRVQFLGRHDAHTFLPQIKKLGLAPNVMMVMKKTPARQTPEIDDLERLLSNCAI